MSTNTPQGFMPVLIALSGNAIVTVLKGFAAVFSGSSAMASEAVHSFADTLNQLLLFIGLKRSVRAPDAQYAYGYGNERFVFALISACGIFFLGAGVSALHGIEALKDPHVADVSVFVGVVLVVSFVIESYALFVAARDLAKRFPDASWRERFVRADSSTLAVLLEDSVAVIGVGVASFSLWLTGVTGNGVWDAIGSLVIAVLLACVAIVLILKNRTYLLGKAMPEEMVEDVRMLLLESPFIERVIDFKSKTIGFDVYRVKCEVEFNGAALASEVYKDWSVTESYAEAVVSVDAFSRETVELIDRVPRLIGNVIDDLEKTLRARYPNIQHIDIEIN